MRSVHQKVARARPALTANKRPRTSDLGPGFELSRGQSYRAQNSEKSTSQLANLVPNRVALKGKSQLS